LRKGPKERYSGRGMGFLRKGRRDIQEGEGRYSIQEEEEGY
jgi:hypothetical protein